MRTKALNVFVVLLLVLLAGCSGENASNSAINVAGKVVSTENFSSTNTPKPVAAQLGASLETPQNIGVPFANIAFYSGKDSYSTKTNANGEFSLKLSPGSYLVIVSKSNIKNITFWSKYFIDVDDKAQNNLGEIFIHNNPIIDGVEIYKDNLLTSQTNFKAGDTVKIKIVASDPNNLPLQYVFRRFRNNGLDITLQDWSNTNEITYTFLEADAVNGFYIGLGVKNNDGVDAGGFSGDASGGAGFGISGLLSPAIINSIEVYKDGLLTSQRNFSVGDTVKIKLVASDPNNLPLQYVFRRFRNSGLDITLQDWSDTNEITYTFSAADAVNGFSIVSGVKNNDGVDAGGFFGDAQGGVSFGVNSF